MSNKIIEREQQVLKRFNEIVPELLREFPQHTEYINLQVTWNAPCLRYVNRWFPEQGRIVSIGSFPGATEIALSNFAKEIVCCDLDDFLPVKRPSNLLFNKLKLDIHPLTFPEDHFDACLCIEVLEHLRWSPLPLLNWVHKHCDLIVVSSPDDREWPAVKNEPWTTKAHFKDIPLPTAESEGNPRPMEHCKQYSLTELLELLDFTGFRVLELQRVGNEGRQLLVVAAPRQDFVDAAVPRAVPRNNAQRQKPVGLMERFWHYFKNKGAFATYQRILQELKLRFISRRGEGNSG